MTPAELTVFSDNHRNIVWQDNLEGAVLFRNESLMWYQKNPQGVTAIDYDTLAGLDENALLQAVNGGLEIEQMTRVTGYFSKVGMWNKGKIAELKDRRRTDLYGNAPTVTMQELNELQAVG
jgi:hypothetical protein